MDFTPSKRSLTWATRLQAFFDAEIEPARPQMEACLARGEPGLQASVDAIAALQARARAQGLWNLFRSADGAASGTGGPGLSNLDYAPLAEIMGRLYWSPEVFNCSAPDVGNMEVLDRYGTPDQKAQWLEPLLRGEIRSAFLMTEPQVASSDATNVETTIVRDGEDYVINGRKTWVTGAADPRLRLLIIMGRTNPDAPPHGQQSQILAPVDAPGVRFVRTLSVFGYDDSPQGHAEVLLEDVRVPASNLILGEGRGFEVAQGRLGPGRIHHCMRIVGAAEDALAKMCRRLLARHAFGGPLADRSVWLERIADARVDIERTRLLCLKAAWLMDTAGAKAAQIDIAMVKVAAPRMALKVIDDAIQAHGADGVGQDFGLARAFANIRTLRLADGPDEVHRRAIARAELARHRTG